MEKIFFFINNLWYLFKTNLQTVKKIKIFWKDTILFLFEKINNKLWKKSINFNWLKIHWLNYSSLCWLFWEIFVRNEYKFYTEKENPIILDLWANIWMATVYFKRSYPKSKILSFEPDKKHFQILEKNIKENWFNDVKCIEKAVTNKTGEITFYTDNKASFSMSTKKWRMSKLETKVKSISITEIIKNRKIDLLKMDIEWWEYDVLEELNKTGKINQINEMIIEYHHNIKNDNMSFWKFLNILEKNWFTYWLNTSLFPLEAKNKFQDIFIHAYRK